MIPGISITCQSVLQNANSISKSWKVGYGPIYVLPEGHSPATKGNGPTEWRGQDLEDSDYYLLVALALPAPYPALDALPFPVTLAELDPEP